MPMPATTNATSCHNRLPAIAALSATPTGSSSVSSEPTTAAMGRGRSAVSVVRGVSQVVVEDQILVEGAHDEIRDTEACLALA